MNKNFDETINIVNHEKTKNYFNDINSTNNNFNISKIEPNKSDIFNNKVENKEKEKENENENENEKDNLKDEKTTITSNESPGYKLNMNTELARQKYLKDLFYNKIKERKEYLHKCFIKLYY